MHHDCARVGADDARNLVADREGHFPPALGPGAHAARGPEVGIFLQAIVSCTRHSAETMRDQIDRSLQDGKLRTPFEKFVRQKATPVYSSESDLIYHICPQPYRR